MKNFVSPHILNVLTSILNVCHLKWGNFAQQVTQNCLRVSVHWWWWFWIWSRGGGATGPQGVTSLDRRRAPGPGGTRLRTRAPKGDKTEKVLKYTYPSMSHTKNTE